VSVLAGRLLFRDLREGSIGFGWWRSQPVKGAVNRGSSNAEEFGEFGLRVAAQGMQLEQMLGLVRLQFGLLATEPALCLGNLHPFPAAHPDQVGFELRLASDTHTDRQWRRLLAREVPSTTADPFLPALEERLSNLTRAGFDATLLVRSAAAADPLPDDHPAEALWWRILDQLPQVPNQDPIAPNAVAAIRSTRTTSLDQQRPVPRSAPPPAFGPSR
jgi:hypothetical protein